MYKKNDTSFLKSIRSENNFKNKKAGVTLPAILSSEGKLLEKRLPFSAKTNES